MKHPKHLIQSPLSAFVLFFFLVSLLGLDLEGFPVLRLLRREFSWMLSGKEVVFLYRAEFLKWSLSRWKQSSSKTLGEWLLNG